MSGAGTNVGIEYQQKVAAWFLLQMYCRNDISSYLRGIPTLFKLDQIDFESDKPIDDLNLFSGSNRIYSQIKHSLSLSDFADSTFSSVISQFVKAYSLGEDRESYLLITSTKSSRKITAELAKLFDSIRLNENTSVSNPLSISEKETLSKYKTVVEKECCRFDIDFEKHFELISSRIHIVVFDIEKNQPLEIAALMQISELTDLLPGLVWANLLQKALEFSSNRQTVSQRGIEDILKPLMLKKSSSPNLLSDLPDWFNIPDAPDSNGFASGVDYFFAKGLVEGSEGKHVIVELYRFDENGKERFTFSNSILKLKNGLEFNVIFRCSTESRLVKYIESIPDKDTMEIVILQGNFDKEKENSTVFSRTHSEILSSKLPRRVQDFHCIHCADIVSEDEILLVDYFDNGLPNIGCVHKNCRRGIDRIVGHVSIPLFADHSDLRRFNIEKWIQSATKSINHLAASSRLSLNSTIVSWDDKYIERSGKYCFAMILADGSKEYAHKRARIDRCPVKELDKTLGKLRELIQSAREKNDPFCFTSISRKFGNYSTLLQIKEQEDKLIEIQNVAAEEYTLSVKNNYEKAEHFYAPVFFLEKIADGNPFRLGQCFILLTDPFSLSDYLVNWQAGGEDVPDYRIAIVENDQQFDNLLRKNIDDGFEVIIDPLVDRNRNIVKGMLVRPLSQLSS